MDTEELYVFIAHSSQDNELMSVINQGLQSNNVKTFTYEDDILGGQEVAGAVSTGIQECNRFLLIVTDQSLDSSWCQLELILALEKAQRTNKLSAIFLIKDEENFEENKLPKVFLLQDMTKVVLQFEDPGKEIWKQSQVKEIISKLKDVKAISSVLPAGNVAHGLVWSHFFGFLQYVLPDLKDKVEEYKSKMKDMLGEDIRMPVKIYELIPESCKILRNIPGGEESGKLSEKIVERGGNKRTYSPTVYKFKDNDGKDFYCVAEYPSSLGALSEMQKPEYQNLTKLSKADRKLQLARYFYTMNAILNHPKNKECNNRARLLLYNEKNTNPRDVLLEAIKEDLEKEDLEVDGDTTHETDTLRQPLLIDRLESVETERKEHDAYIAFCEDCDEDTSMANTIYMYLEEKSLNVITIADGRTTFFAIEESRWLILVLSKKSMKNGMFFARLNQILERCLDEKRVRMIPVLVDIDESEVPNTLRWVVYIDTKQQKESDYLHRLCQAVKGSDIPMFLESHIPAGNVAHGLAWAYYFNFLKLILPESVKQLPSFLPEEGVKNGKSLKKCLILVPDSCCATGKVNDKNESISCFEHSLTVTKYHGGSERSFHVFVFGLQDIQNDEVYYFSGLYAAAVLTLHEMHEFLIAGIQDSTMKSEAVNFCDFLQAIVSRDAEISKYVEIVKFDDSDRGNLARKLLQGIRNGQVQLVNQVEVPVEPQLIYQQPKPEGHLKTVSVRSQPRTDSPSTGWLNVAVIVVAAVGIYMYSIYRRLH